MDNNSNIPKEGKIPFYDKIIYSLSSGFSSNVAVWLFSYYLTYFLVDIRGLQAALAGSIILCSRIFDTFTDFIIGTAIDRTHFKSGKFRGWIKLGMIPMFVGLPLVFADIYNTSMTFKVIWTVLTYGTYGSIFTTILYTPTNAELVNMTADIEERSSIVGWREIFNNLGLLFVAGGFLPLVKFLGKGNEGKGFMFASAIVGGIAFIFQIWNLMMQRKYELNADGTPIEMKDEASDKDGHVLLTRQLKRILNNKPALVVIIGLFIQNIQIGIKSGFMIYIFKYYFYEEAFYSIVMIFFTLASVAGAMMIQYLIKLFKDSSRSFMITMTVSVVLNVTYFVLIKAMDMKAASESIHYGLLFMILIASGLVQGSHYGFPTLLISNAVDYGEWKNKKNDIGIIYGFNSLAMSFGSAVGGALVGLLLEVISFKSGVGQSAEVLNGLLFMAIILPVLLTIAQMILQTFYGLNDELHDRCVKEIEERKAAE